MKRIPVSETDLAAVVVRHFQDIGAEVYQEVAPWSNAGARADIVAVLGRVLNVIEVKASASLQVIEQAHGWRGFAHRRWIAIPQPRHDRLGFAGTVCEQLGIGVLGVEIAPPDSTWRESRAHELLLPQFTRNIGSTLRRALCEEMKTFAVAGNAAGKFWSPFKNTCQTLRSIVETTPGLTWREAIKRTKHHYSSDSSAASNLFRLATSKNPPSELTWLQCSADRPARLYLASATPLPPQQGTLA